MKPQIAAPDPRVCDSVCLGLVPEFAYLLSSLAVLMLLVWKSQYNLLAIF